MITVQTFKTQDLTFCTSQTATKKMHFTFLSLGKKMLWFLLGKKNYLKYFQQAERGSNGLCWDNACAGWCLWFLWTLNCITWRWLLKVFQNIFGGISKSAPCHWCGFREWCWDVFISSIWFMTLPKYSDTPTIYRASAGEGKRKEPRGR